MWDSHSTDYTGVILICFSLWWSVERSNHSRDNSVARFSWNLPKQSVKLFYFSVLSYYIFITHRDCYWPLQAPPGKRLLFHFFTLMIGNDSNCDHDYLEVYPDNKHQQFSYLPSFCSLLPVPNLKIQCLPNSAIHHILVRSILPVRKSWFIFIRTRVRHIQDFKLRIPLSRVCQDVEVSTLDTKAKYVPLHSTEDIPTIFSANTKYNCPKNHVLKLPSCHFL